MERLGRLVPKDLVRGTLHEDAALVEDEDLLGCRRVIHRVRNLDDGDAPLVEAFDDGAHLDGKYSVGGVGDGLGLFSVALPDGEYQIKEISSPAGYVIVNGAFDFSIEDGKMKGTNGDYINFDLDNMLITIKNEAGVALPSTGGPGTQYYTASGLGIIAIALLLLFRKRKMLR